MPLWLRGDIIDVRKIVSALSEVSRIHGLRVCFHKMSPGFYVTLISVPRYLAHPAPPHVTEYRKSAAVPRACAVRGKAAQWNRCKFSYVGDEYNPQPLLSGLAQYRPDRHRARMQRCAYGAEYAYLARPALAVDGEVRSNSRAVLLDAALLVASHALSGGGVAACIIFHRS